MKKLLRIIAIVLMIVAVLLLIGALVEKFAPGSMNSFFQWAFDMSTKPDFWTWGVALAIGLGLLLVAIIISPSAANSLTRRVTAGLTAAGTGLSAALGGLASGLVGGFSKALGLPKWLMWAAGAGLAYLLWPSAEERSARAERKHALALAKINNSIPVPAPTAGEGKKERPNQQEEI